MSLDSLIPTEISINPSYEEINKLHDYSIYAEKELSKLGQSAILAVLFLGYKLKQLKAETPHGKGWSQLFQDPKTTRVSFLKFSQRTAQRYMACHDKLIANIEDKEDRTALLLLMAQPADKIEVREFSDDFLELISSATKNAETPRQMMINLRVIKATERNPVANLGDGRKGGQASAARRREEQTDVGAALAQVKTEEELRVEAELQVNDLIRFAEGCVGQDVERYVRKDLAAMAARVLRELADRLEGKKPKTRIK